MPVYRPRTLCVLTVPLLGSSSEKDRQAHGSNTYDIPVRVNHITLERNNHLLADSCTIVAEYSDLNVDPRFLKNATVQIWIGNQVGDAIWTPSRKDLRFTGICIRAARKLGEENRSIEMEFRDYTQLFLAQKPYSHVNAPSFKSSLRDAWRLICDHVGYYDVAGQRLVSNVEALKEQLVARGNVDLDVPIGKGVPERLAKYGKVTPKSGDDAWTVWQRVVMGLGLISYIDKDECIVTDSGELFGESDAPALIYGKNILDVEESVDTQLNDKGVHLTSYDHSTGRIIEAFYPEPGDPRIHVKRAAAKKKKFDATAPVSDQYETYEYHDVTDPNVLLELATRAYEERSRQEITGNLKTAEMVVSSEDGTVLYDLLDLGANQNLTVRIDRPGLDLIRNYTTLKDRIQKLVDVGYDEQVAGLLARNLDAMAGLGSVFHTQRVTTTIEDTGDAGNFEVSIHYWNKIQPIGDTD